MPPLQIRCLGPPILPTPHSLLASNVFLSSLFSPNACGTPNQLPATVNATVSSHCTCPYQYQKGGSVYHQQCGGDDLHNDGAGSS
ncbi:condensin-2 complex subunit d3-like protein [Sesbania bispinosa]|nr:condensin-2 complex subunit d3-like protein [Sesbania bispinosa]